jgi:hypothetical protein
MKKFFLIAVLAIISASAIWVGIAQTGNNNNGSMGKGGMGGMGMGKMSDSTMMCGMMMHCMTLKNLAATSDGGVVVTMGNKVMKYDRNLTLEKEMEIPIDTTQMQKMMSMMRQCPMTRQGTSPSDTSRRGQQ